MKHTAYIRPMLAGLSLVMASSFAMAQNPATPGKAELNAKPQSSQCAHGKGFHDRKGHGHHAGHRAMHRAPSMMVPAALLAKLDLSEAQKAKFFDAQTQTQAMKQALRKSFKEQRAAYRNAGDKSFNPQQMFERQNQRFEKVQATRLSIQKQWLGFWDSLSDAQKETVQKHMQARMKRAPAQSATPQG